MKILITGASSGIGHATSLHLAQKGHQVLMAARRLDRLKEIAAESPAIVGEFLVGEMDVSEPSSVEAFFNHHKNFLDSVDVLVNNAGLAVGREPLQDSDLKSIHQMLDTNVTGLLEVTRRLLPSMLKHGSGHIVNLGSIAGSTPYAGGTVYCATKAAVHMITDALRMDLAGTGLRVSTIAPGRVSETEFSLVRFRGDNAQAQKVYEGFRPLTARDVADAIAWMIDRPAHVNIQELVIMPTDQPNATTVVPKSNRR